MPFDESIKDRILRRIWARLEFLKKQSLIGEFAYKDLSDELISIRKQVKDVSTPN